MKHFRLICWFLIWPLCSRGESEKILDIVDQIGRVEVHSIENYPPGIEDYREEVSKYYTEKVFSEKSSPPPHWAAILLTLDDPAGVEIVIQKYYDMIGLEGNSLYDNQFALGTHAKESVLPYIYEDVHHGTNLHGFRRDANLLVLHIIKNSHRFPEATRQWAKELMEKMIVGPVLPYADSILAQIKDWLYHNRVAILDEKYEDATWLPAGPLKEAADGQETRKPSMALLPRPVLTKLVKTLPQPGEERTSKARLIDVAQFFPDREREPKREAIKTEESSLSASSQTSPWVVWLACLAVLFGAILWRWSSKSKAA